MYIPINSHQCANGLQKSHFDSGPTLQGQWVMRKKCQLFKTENKFLK